MTLTPGRSQSPDQSKSLPSFGRSGSSFGSAFSPLNNTMG